VANKTNLKNKLIKLTERRLEEIGYSFEEIQCMGINNLSIGELVLVCIGALETIEETTPNKDKDLVEYKIRDKDLELLQSIKIYEVEKKDSTGKNYKQFSLINF